jgi:D-psicose/D-tagatose/L-ribulose 3-epimerase
VRAQRLPRRKHIARPEKRAVSLHARVAGYDGWLTIESFGASLGAFSAAVAIWRDIEPMPDAIAFDGVEFLRRAIASLD